MLEGFFDAGARERIAAAVRQAEARSTGQIVTVVVEKADDYPEARLRGALYAVALAAAAALAVDHWLLPLRLAEVVLGLLAAAAAGALAAAWDPLERRLARGPRMAAAVHQRALRAFHEHDLHHTAQGTGVLVFAALFERRAEILGDHGIDARMGEEDWQRAAALLAAGMGRGDPAAGFCDAVGAVGERLAEHFPRGPVSPGNELPDGLRASRD